MPTPLDQIVQIVIDQQTQAVPQAGFGIPLILGPTGFGVSSDILRAYTSPAAMLTDGFLTSDIEYVYAVEAFEQALSPTEILVGKRLSAVAQIDTVTITSALASHQYKITIAGVDYSYTAGGGDSTTDIAAALAALIQADSASPASAGASGAVITETAKVAGAGFTTSINGDSHMSLVHTIANYGIANDLAAILNVPTLGNLWYGLALCSNTAGDIKQAAAFIETQKKIFLAASGDSSIDSSSTTDLASVLHGLGYKRTALMFSPGSYNLGIDAGLLGGQLPQTPGASTWKFKSIIGVTPDNFTATSRARLIGTPGVTTGKTVNIYETVGGVPITEEGWMVGGQFIDITVGLDWLESILQTNIYATLVNLPKIPYTDKGVAIIENLVRQSLKQADDNGGTGLLDSTSITVTTQKVADIPANTRAARILPEGAVTFTARLTGAFHFIVIKGTVTV